LISWFRSALLLGDVGGLVLDLLVVVDLLVGRSLQLLDLLVGSLELCFEPVELALPGELSLASRLQLGGLLQQLLSLLEPIVLGVAQVALGVGHRLGRAPLGHHRLFETLR
jgi:hypothetical protein